MTISNSFKITSLACLFVLAGCDSSDAIDNIPTPPEPVPAPVPESEPNSNLFRSDDYPGITCEKMEMQTKDGFKLSTYVYMADADESRQYPTILTRTPYGRSGIGCFINSLDASLFVDAGYVFVQQETRGTNTSEGTFSPFFQESEDGEIAVDWITMQPWSNGDVGIRGVSYLAIAAWQAAITSPPGLKAISVSVAPEDYHREAAFNTGVFQPSTVTSWFEGGFVADQIIRREQQNGTSIADIEAMVVERQNIGFGTLYSEQINRLPLTSIDLYADLPLGNEFSMYLDNPYYNELWRSIDSGANVNKVQVPALIHGAWYDIFSQGSFESFKNMKQSSANSVSREGTKLMVSQYGHGMNHGNPDFGLPTLGPSRDLVLVATGQVDGYQPYDLDFFNYHIKGEDNGVDASPDVQLTILVPPNEGQAGSTFLIESDSYPLASTVYTSFYLASRGDANDRNGSGQLVSNVSTESADIPFVGSVNQSSYAADLFSYDPLNPVPTTGGNLCCGTDVIPGGPKSGAYEQADVENRQDVLVYTSAPMERNVAVIGPVKVTLFAKTDGTDTDFTAKLVAVRPDGATHNLVDGIVRARLRNGSKSAPELIVPNRTYEYEIELGNVGTMVPEGHQIRLQISSSNFPKYARNLNTGASNETTAETRVANQVILHDADHPSRLILPIVPDISPN